CPQVLPDLLRPSSRPNNRHWSPIAARLSFSYLRIFPIALAPRMEFMPENIQTVSIARETHERYLRYAVSVITSRALPDVPDGLKPVQRRILYTMYNALRLHFDGRPAKSARIVGDVMGKSPPHGDTAIYDALVRMTQNWVMRLPLVHGQ